MPFGGPAKSGVGRISKKTRGREEPMCEDNSEEGEGVLGCGGIGKSKRALKVRGGN